MMKLRDGGIKMTAARNSWFLRIILFLFAVCLICTATQAKYSGGTGEPNDPYQIATAEDLILLGKSLKDYDKHFILTVDIDLDPNLPGCKVFDKAVIAADTNDVSWGFEGTHFFGVFDGNGHKVSNLTIKGVRYLGFFGKVGDGAMICNLGLEDVRVYGTGWFIGGLVGLNDRGSIITSYSKGTVAGEEETVGGLAGANFGNIATSYSIVLGDSRVSGLLAGWNSTSPGGRAVPQYPGLITNCYAACGNSGIVKAFGLVGRNHRHLASSEVLNCFWDAQTCGLADSTEGGTPKTTEEMQTASTFINAGWDFIGETDNGTEDIWWIDEGRDYPRLWWETE